MNDPIDINTKKTLIQENKPTTKKIIFTKEAVYEVLGNNVIENIDIWSKFQQQWCNKAFLTFKDYDKYLILIYFFRQLWQSLSDKFTYFEINEFYNRDKLVLEKLNLIKISEDLKIPKETVRRKVNELQKENVLIREGKSIILNKAAIAFQKPDNTIKTLSLFLHKKSKILANNTWFGEAISDTHIKKFIEKYFTIVWLRFFKLQIPFLIRNRENFRDLETWNAWGVVALNNAQMLKKKMKENVILEKIDYTNYIEKLLNVKTNFGINGSSIADVSGIPRATVIRKIKWLKSMGLIKKNKKIEYVLSSRGKLNRKINQNFIRTQEEICMFVAEIFDLIKNSKFKI